MSSSTTTTSNHLFKYFLLCVALSALLCNSSAADLPKHRVRRQTTTTADHHGASTTSVGIASAISAALAASASEAQQSRTPTIALPLDVPEYDGLHQFVAGMPPLQITTLDDASDVDDSLNRRSEQDYMKFLDELRPPHPIKVADTESLNLTGRQAALRVMVVGDSMSQGQQGDWTWRYRIWEWFTSNGVSVEFVGPYPGTLKPADPSPPAAPPLYGVTPPSSPLNVDGGYAAGVDPAWSGSGHFSVWGRAAAVDQYLIQQVVSDYPADLMLLMLGFNDMGWFYSGPSGTINSIYNLIENARASNPNMKFAVANVPQRTSLGRQDLPANTDTYNANLAQAIPYWTSDQSPIALVHLQENYDCSVTSCPAGYDGLHPNALGEYQIAQAFSQTLYSSYGYGSGPIVIPSDIPARPLPVPSNFQVATSPQGVTATWDAVYGAYSYDVESRISGLTDYALGSAATNRWDQHWPLQNSTYDIYVRATAGNQLGDWTATGSAVALPQTAPAPMNVHISASSTGMDLSWDQPTGPYTDSIVEYNVIIWDQDTACSYINGAAFTSSPAHITGLNVGHRYFVAIETWNANGEGWPLIVNGVVPGAGTPPAPSSLELVADDATTVYYAWEPVDGAAGYSIWTRNVNSNSSTLSRSSNTTLSCGNDGWLFPGVWNYEFCVSSYNGDAESTPGSCNVAPSPTSGASAGPTCPPAAPWCSGGSGTWGPAPEDPGEGTTPGEGDGLDSGGSGGQIFTLTTTINGQLTTIVESITPVTTTNSNGQTITTITYDRYTPTSKLPAGATITTVASVGSNGVTTLLVETIYPVTTTDSSGNTITSTVTDGGNLPNGGGGTETIVTTDSQGSPTTQTVGIFTTTDSGGGVVISTSVILPSGGGSTETVATTDPNGQSTTETLVVTTATDSQGSTVVGTITEGPTGKPTILTGLTTYTTFPSTVSWSSTSVGSNTHDSSGHPVLAPWPPCWFCPPGSHGIVLFGIGPGVYPAGGPPAGLPTPFPPITIGPNGDPTYPTSQPTTPTRDPTSTCESTAVPSCTVSVVQVTYTYPDLTSSSVSSSTTTVCNTVTACSETGGTTTTTSATATTSTVICEPTNCGNACAARRGVPTQAPKLESPPWKRNKLDAFTSNFTLSERDLPGPGTGDWSQFYSDVRNSPNTIALDNDAMYEGTQTSVEVAFFNQNPVNVLVQGLVGCTSVIAISHSAAFVSHIWEGPTLKNKNDEFQTDVTDLFNNFFTTDGGVLFPASNTQIFIMTATRRSVAYPGDDALAALVTSQDESKIDPRYTDEITSIQNTLNRYFPTSAPFIYVYDRVPNDEAQLVGGWGKLAVLFDPAQSTDPADGSTLPANTAAYQVYTQGYSLGGAMTFVYTDVQIWHYTQVTIDQGGELSAATVAAKASPGAQLDVCNNAIEEGKPAFLGTSLQTFDTGNYDIDQAFTITDVNGNQIQTGCKFAATLDSSGNVQAGVLNCDNGYSLQCVPTVNPAVDSCGDSSDLTYTPVALCRL